jgi:hypothetical protein
MFKNEQKAELQRFIHETSPSDKQLTSFKDYQETQFMKKEDSIIKRQKTGETVLNANATWRKGKNNSIFRQKKRTTFNPNISLVDENTKIYYDSSEEENNDSKEGGSRKFRKKRRRKSKKRVRL